MEESLVFGGETESIKRKKARIRCQEMNTYENPTATMQSFNNSERQLFSKGKFLRLCSQGSCFPMFSFYSFPPLKSGGGGNKKSFIPS